MRFKQVVLGIAVGSFLVVESGPQAEADMRTKFILLGTAFLIGVMEGKNGAEAARTPETPKQRPHAPASQSPPHSSSSESGPTTQQRGKLYKLEAEGGAKEKYCISIFGRLCYPCNPEGNSCRVRQGEDPINMATANVQ